MWMARSNNKQNISMTIFRHKWAASWQNLQNGMHSQWSLRSAWASTAWRKLGFLATHWVHSEVCSDWADAQADLSLRWAQCHSVSFVMRRLISYCSNFRIITTAIPGVPMFTVTGTLTFTNFYWHRVNCTVSFSQEWVILIFPFRRVLFLKHAQTYWSLRFCERISMFFTIFLIV